MQATDILTGLERLGGLIPGLGIRFEERDGDIVYRMPVRPFHTGGPGVAHGGALMTLLDTALGARAVVHAASLGKATSTVEMKVNFIKPARLGRTLVTKTKMQSAGKTLLVVSGSAHDEASGEQVAFAVGTFNLYHVENMEGWLRSLKPSQGDLHLYTAATMNGYKPVILLEELGVKYELTAIDFDTREQKSDWYTALNPNGRIPTLVDKSRDDFVVFESAAILWYIAERYGAFLPTDPNLRSEALQWLMFQMSGVGPMMGQAMYFQRIAAPQGHVDDFAIERYVSESRRLLEVVDRRLEGREYLVGDGYSIVDMAMYPYARAYPWARVPVDGLDNLKAWFDRIDARPAVQRALTKPKAFPAFYSEEEDEAAQAENAARFAQDVKK